MKTVYQGKTETGKEIIIRYPDTDDLKELLRYINELSDEKTFIRYQGEHETLKSETKFLKSRLEEIESKKAVHLLTFSNNKLIAASHIGMMDKTERHVGVLGITVIKDFRSEGIGKLLMELIIKEAERKLLDLKIITLEVYGTNFIAQNLYKKLGFIEYGRLPNGITRAETFEDAILMYKDIK